MSHPSPCHDERAVNHINSAGAAKHKAMSAPEESECNTLCPERAAASPFAPSVWHCKACATFLPVSDFYPSSIARRIHSCKRHMDSAVRAAVSRARVANPQRSRLRKVLRRIRRRYGDATPSWATKPAVVQPLLDQQGWRSTLSGSARAVTLVPKAALALAQRPVGEEIHKGGVGWSAHDTMLVTEYEASALGHELSQSVNNT
jgi:hypothetical protein